MVKWSHIDRMQFSVISVTGGAKAKCGTEIPRALYLHLV